MPEYLKKGSIEGIWLYTWTKLEKMSWDEEGIRANLVSDREQTLTLRNRKPGVQFFVNGEKITPEGDHITYHFSENEAVEIVIKY